MDAIDLHIGRRLRLDIRSHGLLVYLDHGTCANSVMRLLTNLQHRYDATAHLALEADAPALTSMV